MKTIKISESPGKEYTFVDVRTPAEFEEDTIPRAVNIPLFSNEERAIVGTIYTKKGEKEAIDKGMEFVSKSLPDLYNKFKSLKQPIIVFCWRGGMRSRSIVNLFSSIGYDVSQLEGGYKEYRKYVRESLENYKIKPELIVLQGRTGVGKTELLNNFDNSLDLEGLAQHRGSLFGAINLKPNSQKKFESLLFKRLEELQNEKNIIVEGEAKKIGQINVPPFMIKALKKGKQVLIKTSMANRVKRLVGEYSDMTPENVKELKEKVVLLKPMLTKKVVEELLQLIDNHKYAETAEILLDKHYDSRYDYAVKDIKYDAVIEEDYLKKLKEFIKKSQ